MTATSSISAPSTSSPTTKMPTTIATTSWNRARRSRGARSLRHCGGGRRHVQRLGSRRCGPHCLPGHASWMREARPRSWPGCSTRSTRWSHRFRGCSLERRRDGQTKLCGGPASYSLPTARARKRPSSLPRTTRTLASGRGWAGSLVNTSEIGRRTSSGVQAHTTPTEDGESPTLF